MEPITLCGAAILVFCIWLECETIILRVIHSVKNITVMQRLVTPTARQRPVCAKCLTGT